MRKAYSNVLSNQERDSSMVDPLFTQSEAYESESESESESDSEGSEYSISRPLVDYEPPKVTFHRRIFPEDEKKRTHKNQYP